ncbi:hypothetical protein [Aurantiacibacter rhizosphaerae]|uniref:Uncharacterized protein n=1 Tax=Aurantiacibacter rhizosphaerae TaxID=2691582 RepID=A0A844XAZ7_9SPHN|nr:hypothetical protein [Aurantiacibacter rhizosphaerae]MWV27136.1 hypothetical protein [Aurantiacibacter rhizosphaerae]
MDNQAPSPDEEKALTEEGRKVREFIGSTNSEVMLRLFDFLLERSLEGNRPKEAEIAEAVFDQPWKATEGSRIRVSVYRLRKKLDQFYEGAPGPRMVIPKGEYILTLSAAEDEQVDGALAEDDAEAGRDQPNRGPRAYWIGIALLAVLNAGLLLWLLQDKPGSPASAASQDLVEPLENGFPTKIALGDYFMFLSSTDGGEPSLPTQDLTIHDEDDFHAFKAAQGAAGDMLMEESDNTVSVETLESASRLWLAIDRLNPQAVAMSQVSAATMASFNVVYVGPLDALSPLIRQPLFDASRFRCEGNCYALEEKASGKTFLSDSPYTLGERVVPRRDFGYIASFPGPSGKQILILSGTGDAGVSQMVRVARDPARLAELKQKIGGDLTSFEALYRVRTMFAQSYASSLISANRLPSAEIWDGQQRSD